jgi:bacterioferritin
MKIEEFVDDLNIILKMEYGAIMQYILHSHRLSKSGDKKKASEILTIGNDEIRHAESLANKIKEIGGKPSITAKWSPSSDDLESMLTINLESERKSMKVYRNLIKIAERENFKGLKKLLELQLKDEIRHSLILKQYLGK